MSSTRASTGPTTATLTPDYQLRDYHAQRRYVYCHPDGPRPRRWRQDDRLALGLCHAPGPEPEPGERRRVRGLAADRPKPCFPSTVPLGRDQPDFGPQSEIRDESARFRALAKDLRAREG